MNAWSSDESGFHMHPEFLAIFSNKVTGAPRARRFIFHWFGKNGFGDFLAVLAVDRHHIKVEWILALFASALESANDGRQNGALVGVFFLARFVL